MAQPRPRTVEPGNLLRGLPRGTTDALDALFARYPDWARGFPSDDPVYAISKEALAGPELRSVFRQETLTAEREFSRICMQQVIVGIWGNRTIAFPMLIGRPLPIKMTDFKAGAPAPVQPPPAAPAPPPGNPPAPPA